MPYLFRGGQKVFGLLFLWIGKVVFFFRLYLSFFVVDQKSCFSGFICLFFWLLQILLSFITIFGLLYGFIVFIVLFEERCLVVYERIRMWVPEVDKCLGEVVDRYSL